MLPLMLIKVIIIINPPIWKFHERQIIEKKANRSSVSKGGNVQSQMAERCHAWLIGIAGLQDPRTMKLSATSNNFQIFNNLLTICIYTLRQMSWERTLSTKEEETGT